jgi:hypothetical protein
MGTEPTRGGGSARGSSEFSAPLGFPATAGQSGGQPNPFHRQRERGRPVLPQRGNEHEASSSKAEESGCRGDCHVESEGFGCGVVIGGVALQGERYRGQAVLLGVMT